MCVLIVILMNWLISGKTATNTFYFVLELFVKVSSKSLEPVLRKWEFWVLVYELSEIWSKYVHLRNLIKIYTFKLYSIVYRWQRLLQKLLFSRLVDLKTYEYKKNTTAIFKTFLNLNPGYLQRFPPYYSHFPIISPIDVIFCLCYLHLRKYNIKSCIQIY